jgi:hypothetical protein
MAESQLIVQWDQTSAITTTLYNVHRGKNSRVHHWYENHPWRSSRELVPYTPDNIHILKALATVGS